MRNVGLIASLVAMGLMGAAAAAQAGEVTFENAQVDESGTGFGSVLNMLTVQASGSGTSEYGEVTWNGSADVETVGDTKNTSATRTASEIFGATGNTDIGIIFNINQTGSDTSLYLHNFDVLLFNAAGGLIHTFSYDGGELHLDIDQQGTGGAGWLFRVDNASSYVTDGTNRFGMRITQANAITSVNDGPENFYITSIPDVLTLVPLPPAALIGLLTLGGAGVITRLRRRRAIA